MRSVEVEHVGNGLLFATNENVICLQSWTATPRTRLIPDRGSSRCSYSGGSHLRKHVPAPLIEQRIEANSSWLAYNRGSICEQ